MKQQIRHNVFETNSSSTHSISIAPGNEELLMDTSLKPDENGNVILQGGEFGWDYDSYYDAQSKASYMAIYASCWSGDKKEEFIEKLKRVIIEQTGAKDVLFNFTEEYDSKDGKNWSYIDHQSVDSEDYHWVFDDEETLRQFIFNRNSVLTTDNDNH